MREVGTVNNLEVTLGQRGMGKSTYQVARARELRNEFGGAYVIGHSLGGRLPKVLPKVFGGGELPISYHPTIRQLDRELRKHPERWHILAPPIVGSDVDTLARATCDDLIRYSMQLSQSIRDRAYNAAHPREQLPIVGRRKVIRDYNGLVVPPIIMIVDEGVAIESASTGQKSKGQDKWFLEWIYSLRHMHTALLYAIQNPTARNWQLLSESTRVTCFRCKHEWALNAIRAAGGTKYEMECVSMLEQHEYIVLSEDEGPSEDGPDLLVDGDNLADDERPIQPTEPVSSVAAPEVEPPPIVARMS